MQKEWNHKVFDADPGNFEGLALELFRFQYEQNPVYRQFTDALGIDPTTVKRFTSIPFLPISLFKTAKVTTTLFEPQVIFESSGTTGLTASRHFIRDEAIYHTSFMRHFEMRYGSVKNWCILGLLPGYLERKHSSLVHMVNALVTESGHPQSGFYLHDHAQLATVISGLESKGQKTLLIGVSFALLDFAENFSLPLRHTIIMETGGMKGRRKELLREELHTILKNRFQLSQIHSEYGMTELLSQAYSEAGGVFRCPPWMRVLLRDDEDPLNISTVGSGALNIIDLANIYSCCFIATEDVGRVHASGEFEVMGRMDGSDLRGCSLMVS